MGFLDKLFRIKKKTFLISDLHLGHELTLLFVPRPFESTHDMNVALIKNWNDTIKSDDVIWHLGDLNWTQYPKFWIHKLHGKALYIQGNHDLHSKWMKRYAILRRGEHAFILVHDPDDNYVIPERYTGWIIHGHHHGGHDKDGNLFPFIDGINKRINVVAELINYRPVDLDWIVSLDLDTIKWMSTINDVPQRWADGEEKPPLPVPRAKIKLSSRPRSKWHMKW